MAAFVVSPCSLRFTNRGGDVRRTGVINGFPSTKLNPILVTTISPVRERIRNLGTTRWSLPSTRPGPRHASAQHQPPLAKGSSNFGSSHNGGSDDNRGDENDGEGDDQIPGAKFAAIFSRRQRFPEVPEWRGNRNRLDLELQRIFSHIRISHLLLAVNIAVFAMQFLYGPGLMARGAKVNEAIAAGEVHRLFSPMFLHASVTHLLVNSFSLHSTGPSVESWFGKRRFISLYLISGVCGNLLSYLCTPTPAVGASGAIFGLVGATAVILARHRRLLGPRARRGLQSLAYIIVMNFGMGLAPGSRIDNFGHLGGFLGGTAFSYLCGPRMVVKRGRAGKLVLVDIPIIADAVREAKHRLRQVKALLNGR